MLMRNWNYKNWEPKNIEFNLPNVIGRCSICKKTGIKRWKKLPKNRRQSMKKRIKPKNWVRKQFLQSVWTQNQGVRKPKNAEHKKGHGRDKIKERSAT